MRTHSFQRGAAWLLSAALFLGGRAGGLSVYAVAPASNSSAASVEARTDRLSVLENQVSDLEEKLDIPQQAADVPTDDESRIRSLQERLQTIENALGLVSGDLPTDPDAQMDDLNDRLLLASAAAMNTSVSIQVESASAAPTAENTESDTEAQLREALHNVESRQNNLEEEVGTAKRLALAGLILGVLSLVAAIAAGVLSCMLSRKKVGELGENAFYVKQQEFKKAQESLGHELQKLQSETQQLHNKMAEAQAVKVPSPSMESRDVPKQREAERKEAEAGKVQEPENQASPRIDAPAAPKQSSRVLGNLKAEFDIALSDDIFLTAGNDYILYDDNTMEYAMKMPYGEFDSYAKNGLLRLYDIQVGDTVYTYQQYKEKKCPNVYIQMEGNLKRAKVKSNAAGAYDLVEVGLLSAEVLN